MSATTDYQEFLRAKSQFGADLGFAPLFMPDFLFDFQKALVDWALRKGRAALFADCGLGKTPMQLVWADNVVRKTNGRVLLLTPLAVAPQTLREAKKFGIACERSPDGKLPTSRIVIANYERLHYFRPSDFSGVVCDESGAIKDFEGQTQKAVVDFMRNMPYRLLCTATPAPNDYIELLTSAEALGEMGRMDALGMFFKNDENSLHPIWWGARWRFKQHAEAIFWRWMCSWSRCVRKPSDLGFSDARFMLPPLEVRETVVASPTASAGRLFAVKAVTLEDQRKERRATIRPRCEAVLGKIAATKPSVVWCHLNEEADLLERLIPGARQVSGSMSDDEKEAVLSDFTEGRLRVLVIKPRIGAWGLNWQHCAHMTVFPSHSYEQYYQAVRRCWRFGQRRKVVVDIVTTEGEVGVMRNMQRKEAASDKMFSIILAEMGNALRVDRTMCAPLDSMEVPVWL